MKKNILEYEKQMHELTVILNNNCEGDERIKELIEWYRKEYQKRPEMYGGDKIVVKAIKDAALTGLSLNMSLMEAYRVLKANLSFIDINRAMGM
jgi:hypothetical protein